MTIANSIVLADNAFGTIATGLAVGDTALAFTTGHGARFPAVASGQVLYLTLLNSTNVLEVVKVTAHTAGSDSATMVRAANGTAAKTWSAGDRIEARWTSEVLKRLQDESLKKTTLSTGDSGATFTGTMGMTAVGYVTGLVYALTSSTTNSGAGPTINLDSLGATTVVLDGGGALAASQMPVNGLYVYDGTNFILLNPVSLVAAASAAEIRTGTNAVKYLAPSTTLAALGFSNYFLSSAQTITAGGAGASPIAHGLGRVPVLLRCYIKCTSTDLGYSVDDLLEIGPGMDDVIGRGVSIVFDATSLTIRFGNDSTPIKALIKSTGAPNAIDPTKWVAYFAAWA